MIPSSDPRRAAVEAFLVEHRAELVAFVARRAPPWVSAEDVLHQVALRTIERADALRDPEAARAWVYTALRRALTDAARTREEPRAEVPEPDAPSTAEDATVCCCAAHLLDGLRDEYGDVIRRADLNDASVAEVARSLGISANNASVRLHRARAALRSRLTDHCGVRTISEAMGCACEHARCGEHRA